MNPHSNPSISPLELWRSLMMNHGLILTLVKREVVGRYKGSLMGLFWSFFNPLLMLLVYTFVFGIVLKTRWAGNSDSNIEFALVLFTGLMVFNLFGECVNKAPSIILWNVNYVKKVVFPLEILPLVSLGSALFHFFVSLVIWLVFHLVFIGIPSASIVLLPFVLLPLVLLTLGSSWFLASLGVYLRDVAQVIGIVTTMLLFLSPIFYPISALPEKYQMIMQFNPLTFMVEQARDVMIFGGGIQYKKWLIWLLISTAWAWLGFAWFKRTQKGFADVV